MTTPITTTARAAVELRYFAAARAALGRSTETLALEGPHDGADDRADDRADDPAAAGGTTVADVVARLAAATPSAAPVLARCSVLLDGRRAGPSDVVPAGSRLDLLPPFAGG